jgi:signal transduction histidine kinase
MSTLLAPLAGFYSRIRTLGINTSLDDYEKRKLAIFNVLNCLGLANGILVSLIGLFNNDQLPWLAWVVMFLPILVSSSVLWAVIRGWHEDARMIYFIFYPLVTSLAYATGVDVGFELFFIVYAVLAVFLLKKIAHAVITFAFSLTLYLIVAVGWNHYDFRLADMNPVFFFLNNLLAVIFIFISLYLFKTENYAYQYRLLGKNRELEQKNQEIEMQKTEIATQVELLGKQTHELKELDKLKDKLFSVIAHDLKAPMYALRNLFRNVQQFDLPGDEIKDMIPEVVSDLNYTTGLMENLLQWAKSQMQADDLHPQQLNVADLIKEVIKLLRLQAYAKKIQLRSKVNGPVYIYANKDMVNLVLRNLISNAIKFTPESGNIYIGANASESFVEVFVKDTGTGMDEHCLKEINANNYFTTKGTANESGTGLGLMLCKEFLAKNGGRMFVESKLGKGSTFSFTLPHGN